MSISLYAMRFSLNCDGNRRAIIKSHFRYQFTIFICSGVWLIEPVFLTPNSATYRQLLENELRFYRLSSTYNY